MTFGFEPEVGIDDDLHPEDLLNHKFALNDGDQFPELNSTPEQDSFDALNTHFGIEDHGHWWEND